MPHPISSSHVAAPSRGIGAAVDAWRALQQLRAPLLIFAATRLALIFVVWAGQVLLPLNPAPGRWFALPDLLALDGWVRWDAGWYLIVAQQGYYFDASRPDLTPAVLPLFPALVRLAALLLSDLAFSGLVVANVSLAAGLAMVYRLVEQRLGAVMAVRTVLLLSLFPCTCVSGTTSGK